MLFASINRYKYSWLAHISNNLQFWSRTDKINSPTIQQEFLGNPELGRNKKIIRATKKKKKHKIICEVNDTVCMNSGYSLSAYKKSSWMKRVGTKKEDYIVYKVFQKFY